MISRSKELEASSKIMVGLLGAGFIGQMQALALRNAATSMWEPKIHVLPKILAEVDFELCTKVGERFDWEECTENWEEIVDDSEIDLFINAGPNHIHAQPTIAAAKKRKHVFCEKPVAVDAAGVRSVIESAKIAKEKQLTLVCGFCWRYHYARRALFEKIHDGAIGDVTNMLSLIHI